MTKEKPWELIPERRVDAPASSTTTGQPWDRGEPPVNANAPAQLPKNQHPNHVPKYSMTRDELKEYFAQSHRNAVARLEAEQFEKEMMNDLRRSFAERRYQRRQQG